MSLEYKTYKELLDFAIEKFDEAGIMKADIEARYILLATFDIKLVDFILDKNKRVSDEQKIKKFYEYIRERLVGKPFQYIINRQNFCGFNFYVDEAVLIPRFDTECLVEEVVLDNKNNNNLDILDLCTGSGAIAVSLGKLGGYNNISASDISLRALEIARKNAENNDVDIDFILSDMFENIEKKYDILVCNPPYIRTNDIEELDIGVKDYEPKLALDGKEDGLYFYRIIADEARKYLNKNAKIYLEIGYDQASDIKKIFEGYRSVEIKKDLDDKDRIVKIIV